MSTIGRAGRQVTAAVGAVLMPPTCCLCRARGQAPDLDLCEVCATLLPANHDAGVVVVAAAPTFAQVLVPFEYAYPVDHLIRALKFRGERVYARVLGLLLAQAHQAVRHELPDVVVPMPLHELRYRERGFNQALEIARFAARRLGVAVDARCLMRTVATREQSGLSLLERRVNVRGAFQAMAGSLRGKRVALVDDVLTTGSTALAASEALIEAGAEAVELWAVARVMLAHRVDDEKGSSQPPGD